MNHTIINQVARECIAKICQENDWTYCQLQLPGCMGEAHGPAHRHKRRWYYDKPQCLLWDVSQWVPACTSCHNAIEYNKELTEQLFSKLRGGE